eukprot:CAMPEP_0170540556 /NCGR_PEP_ID=MMETSP0211-20121228/536_1 /TAXON_ID=311385 /ORGANISM="Pseudokeronopsis sp., Strain OXSARD2" /LENGTH=68 /DNA_ID=CAMNT_0010843009 /DNA_START=1057 /DNA_END=1263 /DNA_ORIENTATION=+
MTPDYSFNENLNEFYLQNLDVLTFEEYEKDKFIVGIINEREYVQMIDRNHNQNIFRIRHPLNLFEGAT